MPTGVYLRTEEQKENIRQSLLGNKRSTGYVHTLEHNKKIGLTLLGHEGHVYTPEELAKMSNAKKGKPSNMKGKHHAPEVKKKISESKKLYFENNPELKINKGCYRDRENNPNWKDGKSFEPYSLEWTEQLREYIRQRDNYQCQSCFKFQTELKRKLHVHHIDENKQNCSEANLISLCQRCHMKGHKSSLKLVAVKPEGN